ncbi:MAG: hypothetical protein OEW60_03095 [Thiovulaceae bacterium]|nr:hypothetical protein [Sulfurimonadaceae bacterium]
MTTEIFPNKTFQDKLTELDDPGTLVLSTSKMRYRSMMYAKVIQCSSSNCSELFLNALSEFYADAIVIDLFDEWVKKNPKTIGQFLDDYDDGKYPDSNLYLVMDDQSLVSEWELDHAKTHF